MSATDHQHGFWVFVTGALRYCSRPVHLHRTITIAVIVGTWLTLLNQGGALLSGEWTDGLLLRMSLNYLTPFIVSNLGLLSNGPHPRSTGESGARSQARRGSGDLEESEQPLETRGALKTETSLTTEDVSRQEQHVKAIKGGRRELNGDRGR